MGKRPNERSVQAYAEGIQTPSRASVSRTDTAPDQKRARLAGMQDVSTLHLSSTDFRPSCVDLPVGPLFTVNSDALLLYSNGCVIAASRGFEEATSLTDQQVTGVLPVAINDPIMMEPPKTSYMFQRMEFDEGMRVFTESENLDLADHPLILESTIMFNAGQARTSLGDFVTSAKYYSAALLCLTSSAPSRYGSPMVTLAGIQKASIPILHNLGQLAYRDGQLQKAITFYETALNHSRVIHGSNHMTTGITLNCLGVIYYHTSISDGPKALSCFKRALKILEPLVHPSSTTVATVLNNIGRVYVQQENFASALIYYEKALEARSVSLGKDHVDYAATAFNTGQSLHHLGQYDRAIELYEEFLRVALTKFSKDHRDIAVVLGSIAQIHQERKEYEKSLPLYMESLRVARSALGHNHAEVAMILNRIGNFHFELEDLGKALKAYKMGFKIEQEVLASTHPNIIVTLSNIGEVYRQQRKYSDALSFYKRAMNLQKVRFGPDSAEVAGALNVIGLIYDQTGRSELALSCLQEALVIRRTVLGDDHIDVSATLTYLGTIFYRRNVISMAFQLFMESLRIRLDKLGRNHQDVSFTLYNVGLCHQLLGDYTEAIVCFEETLRIEQDILGEDHRDVAMTRFKLAEAYHHAGDNQKALNNFRQTLKANSIRPVTKARAQNEIGNILLEQGNVGEAVEAFSAAARHYQEAGRNLDAVRMSPALKIHRADFGKAAPAA